jgi:transcriptional regulator with XRE-family HTH domain
VTAPVLSDQHRRTVEIAIGKKLSSLMATRQVSYADMAKALSISDMRVSRIINGTTSMDAAQLFWAAKVLEVPVTAICPQ